MKYPTAMFFDATSADNFAAFDAATRKDSLLDVKLCIISGRAANNDRTASIERRDEAASAHYHLLNTKRVTGYLARAGRSTPVYQGEEVFRTQLRTVISHAVHADEHDYDTENDWGNTPILGNFVDALAKLREVIAELETGQQLLVLVGGPCTELAIILRYCPDIAARIGMVIIQAGDFATDESSNLKGGKGNSFNGAVDAAALHDLLYLHKGEVIILPSNQTKQRELAVLVEEIEEMARPELGRMYRIHAARRGGATFIHDLGLVMLAEQYLRRDRNYPYRWDPVRILEVPVGLEHDVMFDEHEPPRDRRGTIVIEPTTISNRYVVTWQDTDGYRCRMAAYLQS
jgi:hypothetical protein